MLSLLPLRCALLVLCFISDGPVFTPATHVGLMHPYLFAFRTIGDPATCPAGANLTALTTPTIQRLCHPVRRPTPVWLVRMISVLVISNCINAHGRHPSFPWDYTLSGSNMELWPMSSVKVRGGLRTRMLEKDKMQTFLSHRWSERGHPVSVGSTGFSLVHSDPNSEGWKQKR